jgi:outer membrane protein OmpA-like peptidoglycan-associated protein
MNHGVLRERFRACALMVRQLLTVLGLVSLCCLDSLLKGASAAVSSVPPAVPPWAVRHELSRAEALLRLRLAALPQDSGVVMRRDADRLTLRVPARLLFEPDNAVLSPGATATVPLLSVMQLLKARSRLEAQITVYTDSIGGANANRVLAEQRAQVLSSVLGAAGIAASRLQLQGAGAGAELASDDTPEGRMENRRIEIVFDRPPKTAGAAP